MGPVITHERSVLANHREIAQVLHREIPGVLEQDLAKANARLLPEVAHDASPHLVAP
jgi:hypothetical protein